MEKILVTGAGGFIGNHLVSFLKNKGYWVRGVDIKFPEFNMSKADEFELLDLRRWENCLQVTNGIDQVYALAADMGGMGFISNHHAQILHNNILINTHTIEASRQNGIKRYFFASSACVYSELKQTETNVIPLKESAAYPAQPPPRGSRRRPAGRQGSTRSRAGHPGSRRSPPPCHPRCGRSSGCWLPGR